MAFAQAQPINADKPHGGLSKLDNASAAGVEQAEHLAELEERRAHQRVMDAVEEASMESFPASDPPSSTTAHV